MNDCRTIALHYLRTWFVVDLAVSILGLTRVRELMAFASVLSGNGAWKFQPLQALKIHQLETPKTQVFPVALKKWYFPKLSRWFQILFLNVHPGFMGEWFQKPRLHRFALRVFSSLQQHWRHRDGHPLLETL